MKSVLIIINSTSVKRDSLWGWMSKDWSHPGTATEAQDCRFFLLLNEFVTL